MHKGSMYIRGGKMGRGSGGVQHREEERGGWEGRRVCKGDGKGGGVPEQIWGGRTRISVSDPARVTNDV